MKKLGEYLKAERKRQGLSLEELATRTKIHVQKLSNIENGEKDRLPAKVFCIGLIKSYARELRADMDHINRLVGEAFNETEEAEATTEKPKTSVAPTSSETTTSEDQAVGVFKVPKVVMVGASLALSLFLLFVIVQVVEKMNSYSREEALPEEVFASENATEDNDIEEGVEQDPQTPAALTEAGAPASKDGTPTSSPVEEPIQDPKVVKPNKLLEEAPPQVDEAKADTVSVNDDEVESEEDLKVDNFGGPAGDEAAETLVQSDNKLTLTALEPVRAEILWSDGYVQVMLLKSQETKTLVFSQPITLRVNNGGAIQVSFNESEKKIPGTFNKPVEIQYP